MTEPQQPQALAPCPVCGCLTEHSYSVQYGPGLARTFRCSCGVEARVEIQAEPFWMQDIRLAQRKIDLERQRLASERSCHPDNPNQAA